MNVEQARFNMIEQQIRPWGVLDAHVLDLLAAVAERQAELVTESPTLNLRTAELRLPPVTTIAPIVKKPDNAPCTRCSLGPRAPWTAVVPAGSPGALSGGRSAYDDGR